MRYLLSVAAFVLLANTSQAASMLVVERQASPSPELDSYLVKVVSDPGDSVGSIVGLSVNGVHQVRENAIANSESNASLNEIGGTFWNPGWTPVDTHLLLDLDSDTLTTSPGFGLNEQSDGSNPADINLAGPGAFADFTGTAGVGSLSFSGNSPQITVLAPRPQELDLLQVVVPAGAIATLDAVLESNNLERTVLSGFEIVPEPASMMLLSLGLVGFAARRSRTN